MAEGQQQRWLPIESNPEVMNKFLHGCGLSKNFEINDVYGLDEALLAMLPQPVLAMLLLFPDNEKYRTFAKKLEEENKSAPAPDDLFYMKQTISNACGTVALIHAVANNRDKVKLDSGFLKAFLDASAGMTPQQRAEKLEKDDSICQVHDTVAKEGQTKAPSLGDSVEHHFIAFVEKDGKIYELDGRKSGPIAHGSVDGSFLKSCGAAIKKYMDNDPENHGFTLVALTPKATE